MWKKTAIILFVVGVLTFSFGVKKTWAAPSSTSCCAVGTYLPLLNQCSDSSGNLSNTICSTPPNNGTCVKNAFSQWVCDFLLAPTPTPTPVECCSPGTEYNQSRQGCCQTGDIACVYGVKSPTKCGGYPCAGSGVPVRWTCDFSKAPVSSPFDPCKNLSAGKPEDDCRSCTGINKAGEFNTSSKCDASKLGDACGTWTSLGCIPNSPSSLVGWILGFGSGIAGGIAFLLIIFGAGQIVLSAGVPEKVAAGKEIVTSAVIGLVFIFLSVLILKIIGVQILGIPGWS